MQRSPRPDAGRIRETQVLARIDQTIDGVAPGPTVVDLGVRHTRRAGFVAAVTRLVALRGFVPVIWARGMSTPPASFAHHHLAIVVVVSGNRAALVSWLKVLARTSPRTHLVLLCDGIEPGAGSGRRVRLLSRQARDDDSRLRRWIDDVQFERAEAWLSVLRVEAAVLGDGRCRSRTLCLWTWLRVCQTRYEEARRVCAQIRSRQMRRLLERLVDWAAGKRLGGLTRLSRAHWRQMGAPAGVKATTAALALKHAAARVRRPLAGSMLEMERRQAAVPATVGLDGLWRLKQGEETMHVLHAIPTVLQLVADADDELMALKDAAVWARRHAGAHGVAFVGAEDGRVVASDGWSGGALADADRHIAAHASMPGRDDRGMTTFVTVPVRYAGGHVGGLVMAGPIDRVETLMETATLLAAVCAPAVRTRLDTLARARRDRARLSEIIGHSPAADAVREAVVRAAASPFPVLVEGESGTGKELVARALHRLSARRDRRFAALNCAALSDDLVEAELFGHSRGAFTGAVMARAGLFEEAHGGVLFLDEVGELSPRAQAKLLRVLQEREIRRVGENAARAIDVRIVAATNRSLADACLHGEFRHDLLFRLAVVRIRLPPLRDRAEDVAPLAQFFWQRAMTDVGKRAVICSDALARLASHSWPGNVRELQNIIAGLAVVAPARGRVGARHVELVLADSGAAPRVPPMSLERARQSCERQTVAAALARHAGRRGPAARELGLTRQGLTKVMRRLRLHEPAVEGVA